MFYYPKNMLNGMRIFTGDSVWRQILSELGAIVTDDDDAADINFDALNIKLPVSPLKLKSIILNEADNNNVLTKVFGRMVYISRLQTQIITQLYKTGGMDINDLKLALGYLPDTTTHAVETAIYQLRKSYGYDFIKNDKGIYKLGKL